jgi:hypothetical protein
MRWRSAACAATLVLAGCATVSGVAPVGDHLYTVSAVDHTGATSPMGLLYYLGHLRLGRYDGRHNLCVKGFCRPGV